MSSDHNKVQVEAPQDMPGGYMFDAEVEGKKFSIAVPEGGVEKGQMIEVPYPYDEQKKDAKRKDKDDPEVHTLKDIGNGGNEPSGQGTAGTTATGAVDAPTGEWRNGLFDCFETVATARFWMACCCECVVLGQLLQRFKLNALGQPGDYENTCMIVGGGGVALYILGYILLSFNGIGGYIWILMAIWMVAIGTFLRMRVRKKYNISPTCCADGLDDCCCIYWCSCCNVIQMSRHTHDESKYPYDPLSKTGLGPEAPEIV